MAGVMKLRSILGALAVVAALGLGVDALAQNEAQARPLLTEDVEILRPGTIRLEAGAAFLQDQDFALSGLEGDLTRIGDVGLRIGVSSNVEVQLSGTIQQFLSINNSFAPPAVPLDLGVKASDTQDVGDFTIATKIKLTNEGERIPSFGVRFGFQMPNTNQSRGIGTNTTNVFAQVLAAKTVGRVRVMGNVGLAILESPTENFSQNDVLLYGLAFRYPLTPRVRLVGEVNGRYSTRDPQLGTEDRSEARVGVQVDAAGLRWDAAGVFGLTRWSPRTGLVLGVTYDIKETFEPAK
jgi:hypothetical protein